MAETKKRGRQWAPIRPVNSHAGRLAEFLRQQIDSSGKTLAALAGEVGYSKSQVSTLLSGRIPPQKFVIQVVTATVPPVLRERRQAEALQLLQDAEHPPRAPRTTVPRQASVVSLTQAQAQIEQIQVYERLTRALEQESELRQAAQNSARLIWVLLSMVHTLDDRVRKLTDERDRLAGQTAGSTLEDARKRIGRAEEQKAKAESELARAKAKRQQAEDLADRLRQEIEALTDELDRLRGDGPSPHDYLPTLAGNASQASLEDGDPEADDIDAALARATAVNNEDADTIDRISTEITGEPAPAAQPQPIVLDNSPTSPNTANKPAFQLKEEAEAAAERGDATAAAQLYGALADVSAAYLGQDDENTLDSRHHHAYWTGEAGDPAAACALYAALITDRTRVLGPDHERTLISRHNHAASTGEAGDPATARDLYAALAADRTRVLGPDHENTLLSRHQHAYWTEKAGDPATARDLHADLAADYARLLGPDHEDTLFSRHEHAYCTAMAGDPAAARDLYASVAADRTRVLGPNNKNTLSSVAQHERWARKAAEPQ
ncbi:tetratricopeptide repeat protein [Streptomyces sp. NPDC059071]|uniref:tetratricopeptide repeat protein n=1 Tax=Streptomyces sp. NPDC059071 TaxID=3346714 RepID=UPI0036BBF543